MMGIQTDQTIFEVAENKNNDLKTEKRKTKRKLTDKPHKQEYKQFMNGTNKHYSLLHKVMDADDYEVILLEQYACHSKDELNTRTKYWEARIENEGWVSSMYPWIYLLFGLENY